MVIDGVSSMAFGIVVLDCGGKPFCGVAEVMKACRVEMACNLIDQLDGKSR
jgi:hypothetical protein